MRPHTVNHESTQVTKYNLHSKLDHLNAVANMNVFTLDLNVQWNPAPSMRQATYSEDEEQYMKMLSQEGIDKMLL